MSHAFPTLSRTIAAELTRRGTDPNAFATVATYVRIHPDGAQFFQLLEMMVRDGHLVRSGQTLRYYRDIQEVCRRHLDDYTHAIETQAEEMAEILGWAGRLMRYYNQIGVPEQPAPARQPSAQQPAPSRLQHAPQSPQAPPAPKHVPVPKPRPKKEPEINVSTKRELVTLEEDAKKGKAKVQTSEGESLVCSGFPPYPPAKKGGQCRADVVRQDGKAKEAKFKKWE